MVSVKSADQKKEFNFFANFVPSFPENASEPYPSEPEIKFLLSRKTSATNQKGGRATHARGTDARSAARDCAIFRGELEVKWKEFLETVEAEKRSDDPIMSMNKQCAISSWNSSADMFRCELGAAGRRP